MPAQLKGRSTELNEMLDCFETPGAHAFIFGNRGVGKTSLAFSSCEKFADVIRLEADVACEANTDVSIIFNDIVRKAANNGRVNLQQGKWRAKLRAFGVEIARDGTGQFDIKIDSVNHAVDILQTVFGEVAFSGRTPAIIIDEFERLENLETKRFFTDLIKQLSARGVALKLIFCGVAKSLTELLGQHESAERYIHQIELPPLSADALWEIVHDAEAEFNVKFTRGQEVRISQISGGYAHFTHLILKNVMLCAYESELRNEQISSEVYSLGIGKSVHQSAARFKEAYETATQKATDANIEVLWSVAHGPHLRKQIKTIMSDYLDIMELRPTRTPLDGQRLRNSLNSLVSKSTFSKILKRHKVGWYEFRDPMMRSYVRLQAEQEGVELGEHNFRD